MRERLSRSRLAVFFTNIQKLFAFAYTPIISDSHLHVANRCCFNHSTQYGNTVLFLPHSWLYCEVYRVTSNNTGIFQQPPNQNTLPQHEQLPRQGLCLFGDTSCQNNDQDQNIQCPPRLHTPDVPESPRPRRQLSVQIGRAYDLYLEVHQLLYAGLWSLSEKKTNRHCNVFGASNLRFGPRCGKVE